ncbi:MAG: DMT family transporter [Thermoplasmata archaeon]|nr:DMT family transporter [Thermoplasmata archaeon]
MTATADRRTAALLYAGMVFAWGFNYLAVRWGLAYASPLLLAALRAGVGAMAVAAYLALTRSAGHLRARDRRDAILIGVPTTAVFYGLWFTAAGTIPPGLASILVYTFPLWVSLLSTSVLGLLPSGPELVALAAGFGGVALATEPWRSSGLALVPSLELLAGAFSWALGTVLFKRRFRGLEVQEANLFQLLGGCAGLGLAALATGSLRVSSGLPLLAIVLWVGIVGTAYGYGVWYFLLDRWRASTVSTFSFMVPVTALLLSAVLLDERPDAIQLAGVALVLTAVIIASTGGIPLRGAGQRPQPPLDALLEASAAPHASTPPP